MITTSYSVTVTASAGLTFFIAVTPASMPLTTFRTDPAPIEQSANRIVFCDTWNRSAMPANPLDRPDLPLFEDENPDVRREASEVIEECVTFY